MSHLQRSFAKAKLTGLPLEPPLSANALREEPELEDEALRDVAPFPDSAQEDDSPSASSASSASSTGTIKPNSKHFFARPDGNALDPLPWTDFFAQEDYLEHVGPDETVIHHVYITPPAPKGPLFVLHHGAGSSGLSFALFAQELRKALPDAGIVSADARGHGETIVQTQNGQIKGTPYNLCLNTLSSDLSNVVKLTQAKFHWPQLPDTVLVGHSLGGPVVTEVASTGVLGDAVLGYAVLDVVEGSAMEALQNMNIYLATRPRTFPSLISGIEWHIRSRTLRNTFSARVSVPSLLYQRPNYDMSSHDDETWLWRTDLSATEHYWGDWFTGLSKKFLDAKGGKLLILAGTDRLDKELMIGQMQGQYPLFRFEIHLVTARLDVLGRYQLQVFPDAGHFIQEDQPAKTAMVLVDFYRRNDRSALVLPPKVGDLLKKKT
ncbi:MAG: hypothetical protein LQ352_000282 [Teloschistes flavicans]|nr:MAG: hypothetical protein LQ352_000282 [Teloschistes flavicans]